MTGWQLRRQPLALAGMLLAFVVAILLAAVLTTGHHSTRRRVVTVTPPTAPAAVVGTKTPPTTPTPTQLRQARVTARRFLASYLPVLYGRQSARTIVAASSHVKAELAAATKTPRAPRKRRPRVTKLACTRRPPRRSWRLRSSLTRSPSPIRSSSNSAAIAAAGW